MPDGVQVIGYADDTPVLVTPNFDETPKIRTQTAMQKIQNQSDKKKSYVINRWI